MTSRRAGERLWPSLLKPPNALTLDLSADATRTRPMQVDRCSQSLMASVDTLLVTSPAPL